MLFSSMKKGEKRPMFASIAMQRVNHQLSICQTFHLVFASTCTLFALCFTVNAKSERNPVHRPKEKRQYGRSIVRRRRAYFIAICPYYNIVSTDKTFRLLPLSASSEQVHPYDERLEKKEEISIYSSGCFDGGSGDQVPAIHCFLFSFVARQIKKDQCSFAVRSTLFSLDRNT
ncbi:hypothetical protein RvY_10812 [Ramazzottius varieornatus]|uniref:Uncharacterized protein n=1 Tax=Ramazzottius varieornatus TaxID=947166 RepID=A0A1D1VLT9_RAMVA|nr:hypothetical protein RvY_10812 [Ramazzottius varieornatus]